MVNFVGEKSLSDVSDNESRNECQGNDIREKEVNVQTIILPSFLRHFTRVSDDQSCMDIHG